MYGVIDLYGQAAQATLIDLVSDYRSPVAEQAAANAITANLAGSAVGVGGAAVEVSEATSATLYSQESFTHPSIISTIFPKYIQGDPSARKNLPLTWFRPLRQLVGRYCSCLLPRQDGGTYQI